MAATGAIHTVRAVSRGERLALTALVAVICGPHILHLPFWVSFAAAALLAWNVLRILLGQATPHGLLRALLTIAGVSAVFLGFGHLNGQTAGVALLVLMLALKLSETQRYRDVVIVLALCCFVLVTQFLFSQSLGMALYLIGGSWLIVAAFVHIHAGDDAPPSTSAAESARLLALAIPVAAALFVLFPRLPGPLWGLPADNGNTARTGLSDTMSPGSIADLARSGAVAFRVRFDGPAPPPALRYWRGPVLWDYDHGTWHTGPGVARDIAPASVHADGPTLRTDITLAPSHKRWLIALDMPLTVNAAHRRTAGGNWVAPRPIDQRVRYIARSATQYTLDANLTPAARQRALALPATGNPRARALAHRWARHDPGARAVVHSALDFLRRGGFSYTLDPPRTSRDNSVDDFLFTTRAGFCEHFAGAFTFLMRAAGVPARVVTGYQGAEHASLGDYWIVRDSDAHAWSEVWLAGAGWVRVDPTAAAAPKRIADGIDAAVADTGDLPYMAGGHGRDAWYRARMLWDAVDAGWNRWFLAYGPDLQQRLFAALGIAGFGTAIAILTGLVVGLLMLVSLWLAWRMQAAREPDPVVRAWQGVCRRLARRGIARRTGETPAHYAERVAARHPALARAITDLAARYSRLRYAATPGPAERRDFIRRARRFHPLRRG
ncbi:transglutaminase TgpA family protein [Salinisphaera sp. RV14]|uniref:transglutaminase TgpA family protein n=1 Tax=unclassified Salinisphaera TaxID=2649847 RepID=UPI003F87D8D8